MRPLLPHLGPHDRVALKGATVAAAATVGSAPLVRQALLRSGILDVPNHRSSHVTPVPRGGGIACLIGVGAASAVTGLTESLVRRRVPATLVITPLAVATLGFADDFAGGLPATVRLAAQLAAGVSMSTADLPGAARPIGVLAPPGIVNVFNFMDGINGISALSAAVWGANASLLARRRGDLALMNLGAATGGSGLGFLPWNAPNARLFLGDTGSYLYGSLMSAGVVAAARSPYGHERRARWADAYRVASPLIPYVADSAQAIVRRRRAGAKLTEAHREHVYQRVVDSTQLSHTQMSLLHAAAAISTAGASRLPLSWAIPTTAGVVAVYLSLPKLAARKNRRRSTIPAPTEAP